MSEPKRIFCSACGLNQPHSVSESLEWDNINSDLYYRLQYTCQDCYTVKVTGRRRWLKATSK